MTKATREDQSFEASLKELESIVEALERGDQPLEKALEMFERGVKLARTCQHRLDQAERKVEMLIKGTDGEVRTIPFEERVD
ncbi:MAG: exodeoxyribonuclease VII small subunit [Acidobacteria bacterium]|nr:exodeoxyribonuclease VII small subunit [Acidobacteriota bacterium]